MGLALRTKPSEAEPERGHNRGQLIPLREQQPRVPIIGLDSGAIPGTKPQPGCSGAALDRAGREIVRSRLHRNRFKAAT